MKKRRQTKKRRSSGATALTRRTVTRREYAELVVRLGSVELQAQRNRVVLDLHTQRIAQIQEELNLLHASVEQSQPSDIPVVTIPPPSRTVES